MKILARILIAVSLWTLVILGPGFTQEAEDASSKKRPFFLPNNPVAAAYVLGRLSNQELIDAPGSEFVYVAILKRQGLERKHRIEALKNLAEIRKTSEIKELLRILNELDAKADESLPVLSQLGELLLRQQPEIILENRPDFEQLATEAEASLTRQLGYASLASGDRSIDKAWKLAEATENGLTDMISAVPLIHDPKVRRNSFVNIEPLLHREDVPAMRRSAITAISSIPGREATAFDALATLIHSGIEVDSVVESLQRLPKKTWPQPNVEPLVDDLISHIRAFPPTSRTEPSFLNAVQFTTELASLLPPEKASPIEKFLRELGVQIIVIRTIPEQMLYDKQLIVVQAGKPVEIVLVNDDAMPHNLIIVTPGGMEEIGVAAEKMEPGEDAQGRQYIPDSPLVLFGTKMLKEGETTKLSFVAPNEVGEYNYVCTFPGHWRRMFGIMAVVNDIEAYLASRAAIETPTMTEWVLSDFELNLGNLDSGRNLVRGKQLFTSLACAQCHILGEEGSSFGPDLTDVFERWNGNRADVLQEILTPSKIIADEFKNHVLETNDGESIGGLILKEDANTITIQSGASEALIQKVLKTTIDIRATQTSSLMPMGLLSSTSKEEILDLMAYLESHDKVKPTEHKH